MTMKLLHFDGTPMVRVGDSWAVLVGNASGPLRSMPRCGMCKAAFAPHDAKKDFACDECMDPRKEAATLFRSGPYVSQRWRAARIVESLWVERHLVSEYTAQSLWRDGLLREVKQQQDAKRRQSRLEKWHIRIAAWAYTKTRSGKWAILKPLAEAKWSN